MSYNNLLVEEKDGIVHLTINRPKALNALNQETMGELAKFFGEDYADRKDIIGVLLRGAGDRAFVAGADIKEFLGVAATGSGETRMCALTTVDGSVSRRITTKRSSSG